MEDGPVVDLFRRPNPFMPQSRFIETIAIQTVIAGNGFIRPEKGPMSGETLWLLPIPPAQVRPLRDDGNPYALKGWRIQSKGGIREFAADELIHIPYSPDPLDPIMGISPVHVSRLVVESDYDATLYNQSILKNSGNLSGILKWLGDDPLTEEEISALAMRWADNYSGADRAGKTAVLSGNFDFQATSATMKDMEWLDGRRWNLADIARAFGVPLVFLNEYESAGLSDAGLRVQERMLYSQTVVPFARQVEQALTEFCIRQFEDDTLTVCFNFAAVEALQEETAAKLEHAQRIRDLGYPINEVNKFLDLGLPDVPWGSESLVNMGLTTATAVIEMASLPVDSPNNPIPFPGETPPPTTDTNPAPQGPTAPSASFRSTDFPSKGDDNAVSLRNSQFPQFDYEWALDLKENHKAIWDAGGNIRGDDAFTHWGKVRDNDGRPDTPAQEDWVREREAWMARHEGDGSQFSDESLSPTLSNVAGIVAVIKWGGICTIGEGRMKEVLNDLKTKLSRGRAWPPRDEEARAALWRAIDRRSQKHFKSMLGKVRKTLMAMRSDALSALKADRMIRSADAPADAINPDDLVAAIRTKWIEAFASSYRIAMEGYPNIGITSNDPKTFLLSREEVNKIAERYFDQGLGRVVEIGKRIKEQVRDTLAEGYSEGERLDDLADRVRSVFNASLGRATLIARTEVQIALGGGAHERYQRQMGENGKTQWLSSRDDKVRDSHRDVDGEVTKLEEPYTNGLLHPCDPDGPPEEVCNCRCYEIPIIENASDPEDDFDWNSLDADDD